MKHKRLSWTPWRLLAIITMPNVGIAILRACGVLGVNPHFADKVALIDGMAYATMILLIVWAVYIHIHNSLPNVQPKGDDRA